MSKLVTQLNSFGRAPVAAAYARGESAPGALDCRKVLGVGPSACKREVKAAYRKLALQFHPDVVRGDTECAEASFREVNRAYESLITALEEQVAHVACDSSRDEPAECEEEEEEEEGDDPWVHLVDGLVDGYLPREDFSNYYSNLKLYPKGRKYQYYQGNW